ncbi:hypothetical protein CEUSTIGMA_g13902.t1, partial [Chlamydomonas eustigma]
VTGTLNMTSGSVPDTAPIYFPTYNGPLVETYFGSDDRYGLNMTNAIMRMYASEADTYSALALSLNSNNTFTDFLYVTHGGNVGIGTTAPAYPMDVNGTTRVNANNTENNKLLVLYDGNAGDPVSTACNFFGLGINGGTLRYQAMPGDSHTFYNGTTATFTTGGTNSTFYGTVSVNGATNVSSSLTVNGLINGQSGLAISYGSISPSLVTGNGGFQTGWNTVVGLGCTDFCSYGQGGPGGFDFWYANNANLTPTQMASMLPGSFEYNGTITATVTSNIGYGCNLGSFGTSVSTRILFLDENDPVSLGPAIQFNAANVGQIIGGGDLCLMPAAQRFVGIGTTSPSYMLDVNGSGNVNGSFNVTGILSTLNELYVSAKSFLNGDVISNGAGTFLDVSRTNPTQYYMYATTTSDSFAGATLYGPNEVSYTSVWTPDMTRSVNMSSSNNFVNFYPPVAGKWSFVANVAFPTSYGSLSGVGLSKNWGAVGVQVDANGFPYPSGQIMDWVKVNQNGQPRAYGTYGTDYRFQLAGVASLLTTDYVGLWVSFTGGNTPSSALSSHFDITFSATLL